MSGAHPENYAQSARVLVVDDDAAILNFIRGVLEDEGLTVMTVEDGGGPFRSPSSSSLT